MTVPPPLPAVPPALEPTCGALLFECLFLHGLRPRGALADALRAEGFDPHRRAACYPVHLLSRCLTVAAPHVSPGLAREAAHRELGRHLVRGLGHTLLGRLLALVLPRLGPVGLLERYPDYARALAVPFSVRPARVAECAFRVEHRGAAGEGLEDFAAGALEEALRATGVEARVRLEPCAAGHFDAHVTW
jgi:uncharacterized protein (TIGR02265 family)